MKIALAMLFVLMLGASASAFAVYKCESGGKIAYGDQPCANATVLDVTDAPASDAKEAGRRLMLEKNAVKRLERERHKREAAEERERRSDASAGAAQRKKCAKFALRQKRAKEDVASSTGAANEKAKLKARRISDDYEAACGRWPERELGYAR